MRILSLITQSAALTECLRMQSNQYRSTNTIQSYGCMSLESQLQQAFNEILIQKLKTGISRGITGCVSWNLFFFFLKSFITEQNWNFVELVACSWRCMLYLLQVISSCSFDNPLTQEMMLVLYMSPSTWWNYVTLI